VRGCGKAAVQVAGRCIRASRREWSFLPAESAARRTTVTPRGDNTAVAAAIAARGRSVNA